MIQSLFCLSLLLSGAHAQEDDAEEELGFGDLDIDIDFDLGETAEPTMTYEGGTDYSAPKYVAGKPMTISHSGGPISVRCSDRDGFTARVSYVLTGTDGPALERMGNGVGISAGATTSSGWAKVRTPGRPSSVKEAIIILTVNMPPSADLRITGGSGPDDVLKCSGPVRASNRSGGGTYEGTFSRVSITSGSGDVTVRMTDESQLSGSSGITASKGDLLLVLPTSYQGRFSARGNPVDVEPMVMGDTTETSVTGTMGEGKASLTLKAGGELTVKNP